MTTELPSGRQFEITHGEQRAIAVEVGAGLRVYDVGGQPVLEGYPEDGMPDGGRGLPLLPWPNRVLDGQYTFEGQTLQLPIDEVARNNAIHGLTRYANWTALEHASECVTLGYTLHPRGGYPFILQLAITYTLNDRGLSVRTVARNIGQRALPFGAGMHPYFTVGTQYVDEALLEFSADRRLDLDSERRIPTGRTELTHGTQFDFAQPRRIGAMVLDDCFTDLARDGQGQAHVTLKTDRRAVSVWMDHHHKYIQVFSGDTLAPARRRTGLAIEPMTCPPNAFQSGVDLIVLLPGQEMTVEWGVGVSTSF